MQAMKKILSTIPSYVPLARIQFANSYTTILYKQSNPKVDFALTVIQLEGASCCPQIWLVQKCMLIELANGVSMS